MSIPSSKMLWALALCVTVTSCASAGGREPVDSGRGDSGNRDSGSSDAGSSDDAAPSDAGSSDAGSADAGQSDAALPSGEICGNGLDDNADLRIDEGCSCVLDEMQACFAGAPALAGVGACARGAQRCIAGDEFASWGACTGSGAPSAESCNGTDDDCDGTVDEDAGAASETCGNGIDDDCNGSVDDGCGGPCDPVALNWGISAAEMLSGASDSTGPGECFGTVYFSGSTGSTTPPGGCGAGVFHCGTLRYGDGHTRPQYCTVRASCTDGTAMATGFGW